MELTAQSLLQAKLLPKPPSCYSKASLLASPNSLPFHFQSSSKNLLIQLQSFKIRARQHRNLGVIHASSQPQDPSSDSTERWLLEPIGDGDSRHIGFKVEMPKAFEITTSSDFTIGRVAQKADMVIPVATVSGVHARIQTKGGRLLVTDLGSTNGTYVDETPLKPGVATAVSPGSSIIFGDINLAMFRVSKTENVETATSEPEESQEKVEAGSASSSESTS